MWVPIASVPDLCILLLSSRRKIIRTNVQTLYFCRGEV